MSTHVSSRLPSDDRNGLAAISATLVSSPDSTHVILAVVDCSKVTTDVDSGNITPTMRIRAIEGFRGDTAKAKQLRRVWRQAYLERTGQQELPFEIARGIGMDPGERGHLAAALDLDD